MDVLSNLLTALPVLLAMMVTQMIKAQDPEDRLKKWYFVLSLVVGMVLGMGFSTVFKAGQEINLVKLLQDGVQNSIVASFAYQFKRALGWKWPGDVATEGK